MEWLQCIVCGALGLNAVNAIRETFQEKDIIRVHPIITNGGGAVNAIPDRVTIESFVRGAEFEGIKEANKRVNRALCGAALSLGANVDIQDSPGYAPLFNDDEMMQIAQETAGIVEGQPFTRYDNIGSGSSDMGDLSVIMPVVHPYIPGCTGTGHGSDYIVADPVLACVGSAKWQIAMLTELLKDDAKRANAVINGFKPKVASKEEYFEYIDSFACSGNRILYKNDGSAEVKL